MVVLLSGFHGVSQTKRRKNARESARSAHGPLHSVPSSRELVAFILICPASALSRTGKGVTGGATAGTLNPQLPSAGATTERREV
jgi:hypothetical protein